MDSEHGPGLRLGEGIWYVRARREDGLLQALRLDWVPVFGDRMILDRLELMVLRAKLQYMLDEVNKELRDGRNP